jgi:hypothetical protein
MLQNGVGCVGYDLLYDDLAAKWLSGAIWRYHKGTVSDVTNRTGAFSQGATWHKQSILYADGGNVCWQAWRAWPD